MNQSADHRRGRTIYRMRTSAVWGSRLASAISLLIAAAAWFFLDGEDKYLFAGVGLFFSVVSLFSVSASLRSHQVAWNGDVLRIDPGGRTIELPEIAKVENLPTSRALSLKDRNGAQLARIEYEIEHFGELVRRLCTDLARVRNRAPRPLVFSEKAIMPGAVGSRIRRIEIRDEEVRTRTSSDRAIRRGQLSGSRIIYDKARLNIPRNLVVQLVLRDGSIERIETPAEHLVELQIALLQWLREN